MARKNLLASVTNFDAPQESEARAEYARRGQGVAHWLGLAVV